MAQVDELKSEIEALSPEDFRDLREWVAEKDWQRWDTQLEKDAALGKLDFLREKLRQLKQKVNCGTCRCTTPEF